MVNERLKNLFWVEDGIEKWTKYLLNQYRLLYFIANEQDYINNLINADSCTFKTHAYLP